MDDYAPIWGVWRVSNASLPLQECGDPVRVVRHHRGLIAKAGMNRGSIGSLQFSGVITVDVIGILQQVAGSRLHLPLSHRKTGDSRWSLDSFPLWQSAHGGA